MELSKIIASIEAGDGPEAWENLRVWYRRFLIFYRKNPKFFGGRRCWWEEIHKYDCVREIRKELLYEDYYECEKDKEKNLMNYKKVEYWRAGRNWEELRRNEWHDGVELTRGIVSTLKREGEHGILAVWYGTSGEKLEDAIICEW